jgi:hypothetical protein
MCATLLAVLATALAFTVFAVIAFEALKFWSDLTLLLLGLSLPSPVPSTCEAT